MIIYQIPNYLYRDIKISESERYQPICGCSDEKQAIINFFPRLRGPMLNYRETPDLPLPEGWGELYGNNLELTQKKCLKKMSKTCSIVKLLRENDEKVIATLGIK